MDKKIAQTIVDQIMGRLGRNINLMDPTGTIIASGDPKRIGTVHEGALEVVKSGKELLIHSIKRNKTYKGTKPGVNLPIFYDGDIVGVVGITGQPEEVMEFGSMVVMMAELLIERYFFQSEIEWVDRLKGFLMEECLKEQQDIEHIKFKLKIFHLKLEPPYQLVIFHVRETKSLIHDTFSAYHQIKNRLRDSPVLYDFVSESDFVILNISHQYTKFQDLVNFVTDVFRNHFQHVQVGLPTSYFNLEDTHYNYRRTLQAFEMTDDEKVYPDRFEAQLLMSEVKSDYATRYMASRIDDLPDNLIDTLSIYFDNHLNISQSAKKLFIHRNTLIYRLDRVKELVGLDPRQFKDAVELQLAIWLYCTKNKHG